MDVLVTMIGNVVVDPNFREMFLKDPIETMDKYGFRLTKADFEMMTNVFGGLKKEEREKLEQLFLALENALYQLVKPPQPPTGCHPCSWSIYPPKNCRPLSSTKAA